MPAASSPTAWPMMSGGVTTPAYIAAMCWSAAGTSREAAGFSSTGWTGGGVLLYMRMLCHGSSLQDSAPLPLRGGEGREAGSASEPFRGW